MQGRPHGNGGKSAAAAAPAAPAARSLTDVRDALIVGDAVEVLKTLPADIVQTCVTSPPFWGQRVYEDERAVGWSDGSEVAFGREPTPEAYAEHSADVLVEIARVLKERGTIWWNVGDSYLTRTILHGSSSDRIKHYGGARSTWTESTHRTSAGHEYLKDKDLTLVPFLVAMAAQQRGLWLRSVIVWSKQQPAAHSDDADDEVSRAHMPEPVADRPVTGHEYVLLFTKSEGYDYHPQSLTDVNGDATRLNVRTVWSFRPANRSESRHGARFPDEMPRRCIVLGSREAELVLDPFAGQGTTLAVAAQMARYYLGIEISPTYGSEARSRLARAGRDRASVQVSPPAR